MGKTTVFLGEQWQVIPSNPFPPSDARLILKIMHCSIVLGCSVKLVTIVLGYDDNI